MNKACLEPIFGARRRLLIFGFHLWNCNGMYVKECFVLAWKNWQKLCIQLEIFGAIKQAKNQKFSKLLEFAFRKFCDFFNVID